MQGRYMRWALALLMFATGISAWGVIGAMDPVPAATLLLPYFEVNPEPEPYSWSPVNTTLVNLRNASPSEVIAHVILYTDYAAPTVAFDVVLAGYGSEELDLWAIFSENSLSLGTDSPVSPAPPPYDVPSLFNNGFESGDLSGWSSSEARVSFETLQAYHAGVASPRTGQCAGHYHGDAWERGYVTVDSASVRLAGFPSESGYFVNGGLGRVNNENVLTGNYELRDPPNNFSHGNPLVHIEASGNDARLTTPGNYTFYARYVNAGAEDNREPLGTVWGARYYNGGVFDGGTKLYYWRDPKTVDAPGHCPQSPDWLPLGQAGVSIYTESGSYSTPGSTFPFWLACGRVGVGDFELPIVGNFGTLYVNFNGVNTGLLGSTSQGVLVCASSSLGRFSCGLYGAVLRNAMEDNP